MFQIGDLVFYPVFGAGVVLNVEDKEIQEEISKYYVINLIITKMNIMVPVYSKEAKKIRKAISREDALRILDTIKQEPCDLSSRWIERYKFYCESIKNGNAFVLSGILRDIMAMAKKRTLSKGDLRYFREILCQISGEISLVLEMNQKEVEKLILTGLNFGDDLC